MVRASENMSGIIQPAKKLSEWICVEKFYRSDAEYCGQLIVANNLFSEAFDLGKTGPDQLAFRATWALDFAFSYAPERLSDSCGQIVDNYLRASYSGVIRLYSKMLVRVLSVPGADLSSDRIDRIAEVTFTRLIDAAVPPSIRVWCMEILYRLPHQESWIDEELYEVLDWYRQSHLPSLRSRAGKLYRKIRNRNKEFL